MIKLLKIFFIAFTLLMSSTSFAATILTIVPSSTSVTVGTGGQTTVSYTVTNNTVRTQSGFSIYPGYGTTSSKAAQSSLSLQNNTCTTLAPSASCTFDVVITGSSSLPATFIISPRVCVYNNAACAQPSSANRVNVTVTQVVGETVAYITNASASTDVVKCTIAANGDLIDCASASPSFDQPEGIALNHDKTIAYITEPFPQDIIKCSITSNGLLDSCGQMTTNMTGAINGIAFNPAGDLAYLGGVYNIGFNYFIRNWTCPIDSQGNLTPCSSIDSGVPANSSTNTPGVAVTPNNKFAYFSGGANYIGICSIGIGGALTCNSSYNATPASPYGLAIHPDSDMIYFSTQFNTRSCQLNTSDGSIQSLNSCGLAPIGGKGIALNSSATWLYVVSRISSNILKCPVLNDKTLGDCSVTGTCAISSPNCFNDPTGITLK